MATIMMETSEMAVNPNIPKDARECIAADLETAKQFAAKARQYRVQAALADTIAQLRLP